MKNRPQLGVITILAIAAFVPVGGAIPCEPGEILPPTETTTTSSTSTCAEDESTSCTHDVEAKAQGPEASASMEEEVGRSDAPGWSYAMGDGWAEASTANSDCTTRPA